MFTLKVRAPVQTTGCVREVKVQTDIQTSLSDFHCNGKMRVEGKEIACNRKSASQLCQRGVTKKCVSVGQVTTCNDSKF
jgi:hypothetical protein